MSGACAVCMRCRVGIDEQMCFLCEEIKETSQFVKRVHHSDEWRCLACANPPCSNSLCEGVSSRGKVSELPSYLWPSTKTELLEFRCLACRDQWECWACHKLHPQTNFSASELKYKYTKRGKPMCLDCMHPPCSNPRCQTCKSCRNPKCTENSSCDKEPEALLGAALSMLKKTKLCSACRTSDEVQCGECEKIVNKDWTNKSSYNQLVRCLDCLHPPCSKAECTTCKSCREPTCTSLDCKQKPQALNPKELAMYPIKDEYVCSSCRNTTTLVKCSDCKAMVREDWSNRSSRHKDVTCYDCLHPQCSYSACTTCKVCRDPTCKSTDCKQEPTALKPA